MARRQEIAEGNAAQLHTELGGLLAFTGKLNRIDKVDYWVVRVPIGILHEVWRTEVQLTLAIQQDNIPKLAFLCRGGLELNIWARYVNLSSEAAKRFHQDAYVDALEMLKLMDKAFRHVPVDLHPVMNAQIDPLLPQFEGVVIRDKVGCSVSELRGMKHLHIGAVAQDVGYGPIYELWNPILSKLLHATAYSVLVAGNDMDGIGFDLVERTMSDLRMAVQHIQVYLGTNNLPLYGTI